MHFMSLQLGNIPLYEWVTSFLRSPVDECLGSLHLLDTLPVCFASLPSLFLSQHTSPAVFSSASLSCMWTCVASVSSRTIMSSSRTRTESLLSSSPASSMVPTGGAHWCLWNERMNELIEWRRWGMSVRTTKAQEAQSWQGFPSPDDCSPVWPRAEALVAAMTRATPRGAHWMLHQLRPAARIPDPRVRGWLEGVGRSLEAPPALLSPCWSPSGTFLWGPCVYSQVQRLVTKRWGWFCCDSLRGGLGLWKNTSPTQSESSGQSPLWWGLREVAWRRTEKPHVSRDWTPCKWGPQWSDFLW